MQTAHPDGIRADGMQADGARSERTAVLITRPFAGGEATSRLVASMGWRPLLAPVLKVAPIATQLPPPTGLQAVLVTSANALPGLPAAYHRLPLMAVGDATAARAREAGFAQVHSAAGDA